jgi:hypothetical protein
MARTRSRWWLLCVGLAVVTGCAKQRTTARVPPPSAAPRVPQPAVGRGLTNVLSASAGAAAAGSSSFWAAPHDPAVLLSPGAQDYAAAMDTAMPQWMVFDLGAPRKVQAAAIQWWSQADRGIAFQLAGRKDSRQMWATLASTTANDRQLWEASFAPQTVGQVRLEVTKAAGQGRTLVQGLYVFASPAAPVHNVAVVSSGLKIDSATPFFRSPNDPTAMFSGTVSPAGSSHYAAAQAGGNNKLPSVVVFSLPKPRDIVAVSTTWYDAKTYATTFRLEAKRGTTWMPVLDITGNTSLHGFYALDAPVRASTFRLTVTQAAGQPRLLARQVALYAKGG